MRGFRYGRDLIVPRFASAALNNYRVAIRSGNSECRRTAVAIRQLIKPQLPRRYAVPLRALLPAMRSATVGYSLLAAWSVMRSRCCG
jgi:hypothetical protein